MRLIDADRVPSVALKNKSIELYQTDLIHEGKIQLAIDYVLNDLADIIEQQPTVDVLDRIKEAVKDIDTRGCSGSEIKYEVLELIDKISSERYCINT